MSDTETISKTDLAAYVQKITQQPPNAQRVMMVNIVFSFWDAIATDDVETDLTEEQADEILSKLPAEYVDSGQWVFADEEADS